MSRFAVLALVAFSLLAAPAAAQQQQQTTTVVGVGKVHAKADAVDISLRVHQRGYDQTAVRAFVNRRTAKLFSRLKGIGLDQTAIESSGVELRQVRIGSRGKRRRHLRYEGTDRVTIRTRQIDLVGKVFDAAIAAKVTDFGALTWRLEDPTAARQEAVRLGARDARLRAEAAAAELGMRVVGVQSLDIDGYGGGYPAPASAPRPSSAGSVAPTSVSVGSTTVEARVRVVFVLEKA